MSNASLAELKETLAEMKDVVKSLNQPIHRSADGNAASYIEPTDEIATLTERDLATPRNKRISYSMPKGYKGAKKTVGWETGGHFYKSLITEGKTSEFAQKHGDVFKGIQGMSVQVGSDGGFLVPPEFAPGIMQRVYDNDIFSRTDNYTVSGNNMTFNRSGEVSRKNGSRYGGARAYWSGEGDNLTKSKPTLKQVKLRLSKLHVLVYLTEELMSDSPELLMQYVNEVAAAELNFALGDAIFNGIGNGMPLGILNSPSLITIAKESGQNADTIVSANIDKMWARKIAAGDYAWYHNQDCNPQLDSLTQTVGTGGVTLYRPENGLVGAPPALLKNAPRVETEFNSTLGDAGDIVLADLSKIVSIQKGGITQMASAHVEFLSDQQVLKFTMRVDARPWEDAPLEPYKGSNSQSAFVAIEARA